jgi:adhesin transport system membrane fusion protein
LPISPGMTAQVDIVTGERTILQYLLKPILKTTDRAMTER